MNLLSKAAFILKHPFLTFKIFMFSNIYTHNLYAKYGEWGLKGFRDKRRLEKILPELSDYKIGFNNSAPELKEVHDDYTANISNKVHAISLELACFTWHLCCLVKPKRVLDMGSGFSSFVFRYYQSMATYPVEVWSVDSDPYWLERTKDFITSKGLSDNNLVTWAEFCSHERGQFDIVLHDLGDMELRSSTLQKAIELTYPQGGMVILDDVHYREYREHVESIVRQMESADYYTLKAYTLDKFGRYATMLRPGMS